MRPAERDATFSVWYSARAARTGPPSARRVERVREKLAEDGTTVYVAVTDGIVGMVATEPGREQDGQGEVLPGLMHVSMVFVSPAWQRRGVGRGLLQHVLEVAWRAGHRNVALWTETTNLAARRLYESVGMNATRERQVSDTMCWVRYEATTGPGETASAAISDRG